MEKIHSKISTTQFKNFKCFERLSNLKEKTVFFKGFFLEFMS